MAPINIFANLFGSSPVRPLQAHMGEVKACVSELKPLFEAILAEDWDKVTEIRGNISKLESKADDLKKGLRMQLPKSIMLPVSRRDLLEVLTMQDKIANKAKDISGLILGRKMTFPAQLKPLIKDFVDRCIDATAQADKTVNELDELVTTGFHGNEIKVVEDMISKLDKIEGDTDKIQVKVRAELFAIETELPPIEVMFLYRIIDWIGDVADLAQRVGSRLQLLLAR